jgi:hypothetical protein
MIYCWGNLLTDWYYPVANIPSTWANHLGIHHVDKNELFQIHNQVLAHGDIDKSKAVRLKGGVPQNLYQILTNLEVPTHLVGQSEELWGTSLTLFCPFEPDQRVTWVVPPGPWDLGLWIDFQSSKTPNSTTGVYKANLEIITIDGYCLPGLFRSLDDVNTQRQIPTVFLSEYAHGLLVMDLASDYITRTYSKEILHLLDQFAESKKSRKHLQNKKTCLVVGTKNQLQSLKDCWTETNIDLEGYLAVEKHSPHGARIYWQDSKGSKIQIAGWQSEPVPVLEPTGIGDSFLAGLLHQLTLQKDHVLANPEDWFQSSGFWDQVMKKMQEYSRLACRSIGPWNGKITQ